MSDNLHKTWYLVQCKPRGTFRAAEHLRNQLLDCFLPVHQVKRKRGSRTQWVTEPLFPHYLFVRLGNDCNWGAIRSTRGVNKVVDFNGKPAQVADVIVQGLQHHCLRLQSAAPEPLFRAGEEVIITEGCFRELEAVVKAAKGEERVVLLLNILNRQQELELPAMAITLKNRS